MKDKKVKQVLLGVGTNRKGEDSKKGWRRVNMVEILCTHVMKAKKWYLLKLFYEGGEGG
jgi:hypothetical protein